MVRKLSLPLSFAGLPRPPTADAIRKRLGGRASTEAGAGELVAMAADAGPARPGVVLFVRGEELDVWVESSVVHRTRRARLEPLGGTASTELTAVARDVRVFAGLHEGQRVRYEHDTGLAEATLVEKCRFGALLERPDGALLGVGFRRIWPAVDGEN